MGSCGVKCDDKVVLTREWTLCENKNNILFRCFSISILQTMSCIVNIGNPELHGLVSFLCEKKEFPSKGKLGSQTMRVVNGIFSWMGI